MRAAVRTICRALRRKPTLAPSVKLLVGLGNPGPRYVSTRHNVGFTIVEHFAETRGIAIDEARFGARFGRGCLSVGDGASVELGILEPETYMNRSGGAVAEAYAGLALTDPADLLVVFDDVDLPFGRLRLRPSGGAGGHRGLEDIIDRLQTDHFPRLRFGVGRPVEALTTTEHVLLPFAGEEARALGGHVARACDALAVALVDGLGPAMSEFNRDPSADG